jgi:siroheme decarboxylase
MQEIDQRDRALVTRLQEGLPLASTPYAVLGQLLDMSEKEVLKRIERLKRDGVIRQISATFDPRALGYRSSLVAAVVPEGALDRAASLVNLHPGVYQNYLRNHRFNLWFTLAIPPSSRFGLEKTVEVLGEEAGWEAARLLPTLRHFKSDGEAESGDGWDESPEPPSAGEAAVVRILQGDIPLVTRPFDTLSKQFAVDADEIVSTARSLLETRRMRRIGAVVKAKKSFSATAMGVWNVPDERVEEVGPLMAAHEGVSQCFLRPVYDDWPYNLFTTVHGRSVDECEAVLSAIAAATEITGMEALFPVREYKRSRIAFFSGDVEAWEEAAVSRTRSAAL